MPTTYTVYFCTDWSAPFGSELDNTSLKVPWNGSITYASSEYTTYYKRLGLNGWTSAVPAAVNNLIYEAGSNNLVLAPQISQLPSSYLNNIYLYNSDGSYFKDSSGNYLVLTIQYTMTSAAAGTTGTGKYSTTLTLQTDSGERIFLNGSSVDDAYTGTQSNIGFTTTGVRTLASGGSTNCTSPCAFSQVYNGVILSPAATTTVKDSPNKVTLQITGSTASSNAGVGSPFTNSATGVLINPSGGITSDGTFYSIYQEYALVNQGFQGSTSNSTAGTLIITVG